MSADGPAAWVVVKEQDISGVHGNPSAPSQVWAQHKDRPFTIDALKEDVKAKFAQRLRDVDSADLTVFADGQELQPWELVATKGQDGRQPLLVTYPQRTGSAGATETHPGAEAGSGGDGEGKRKQPDDATTLVPSQADTPGRSIKAARLRKFVDTQASIHSENVKHNDFEAEVWKGFWFTNTSDKDETAFFIRPCFEALFEKVTSAWKNDGTKHVLLLGTPGTGRRNQNKPLLVLELPRCAEFVFRAGKTYFLNYVAKKLLEWKDRKSHLVLSVNRGCVCIRSTGEVRVGSEVCDFEEVLDTSTIVLIDLCDNASPPPGLSCRILCTSSPNRKRYGDFAKTRCITLYFPLWSKGELDACRQSCYADVDQASLDDRFVKWGGVARWTVGDCSLSSQKAFEQAMSKLKFAAAVETLQSGKVDDEQFSHSLIHFAADPSFENGSWMFASNFVRDEVLRQGEHNMMSDVERLAATLKDKTLARFRGQLFEAIAHHKAVQWATLQARKLGDAAPNVKLFQLGTRTTKRFRVVGDVGQDQYGIPISEGFAAVDSIAPPNVAFQMTVSTDHGILVKGLQDLINEMPHLEAVVFVVPEEIANDYPKQKYLTKQNQVYQAPVPAAVAKVAQYVVGISLNAAGGS